MNKNSLFLFLLLLFGSFCLSHAQKFEGEVILGPSITSTRGNDSLQSILKATVNFSGGFGINYHLKTNQLVSVRLLFDKKGASTGYEQVTFSGPNPGDFKEGKAKLSTHYDYLTLPIQYKYRLGSTIQYEFGAGMYASYLLSQYIVGKAKGYTPPQGFEGKSNATSNDRRYDLGLSAGFSIIVPLQKSLALNVGINDNFGLTNAHKTTVYDGTSTKHNSLMLLLGINYKFKKD